MSLTSMFAEKNGNAPQNAVISPVQIDFSPETAHEKEAYFDFGMSKPSLTHFDNDALSIMQETRNNEGFSADLLELASVTGDKLGINHDLSMEVDKSLEAVFGADGMKSLNLSAEGAFHDAIVHVSMDHMGHVDAKGHDIMHLDLNAPEIREENDLELAIQRAVEILAEAGVPESELNKAMAAGGVDNNFETLEAMKDLADDYKVPEAQGYLHLVESDMVQMGIGGKMAEFAPASAANDEFYVLEQQKPNNNSGTQPKTFSFG